MKIEKVKISKVKLNPNNPRLIKDEKFKKLVNSIKELPEMLEIRPIVVNSDMIVLGGNMRLKACKEAGLKEVYIIVADNLTEEQQREFLIKDNTSGGDWDWDMLANEWDNEKLNEWGLDVWQPEEEIDYSVLDDIDLGETLDNKEAGVKRAIMIEFDPKHYDKANELITQARKDGKDVGLIVLNAFSNEL
tara:strand:- start:2573 stop:3142 length:570 start_codon:yes stop_codon:yes gene_type:complete